MKRERGKIVKLHQKRGMWAKIKVFLCFALVCAVAAFVYALRDNFSILGIKQLAGIFDSSRTELSETGMSVELERGRTAAVKSFKNGFAVVTEDSVKYINGRNRTAVEEYAVFSSPVLIASDRVFMAYDRGGSQYVLANNAAVLKNDRTDGNIISAAVNGAGYYAFVTDSRECRGSLALYDNKQQPVFTWMTSTYYLSTVAISSSGRYTAVSCMSERDGDFMSEVAVIDSHSEREDNTADTVIQIGSDYIFAISFLNDNMFYVIKEGGAALYSTDGILHGEISFDGGVYAFACEQDNPPVIAANSYETDSMILNRLNGKCEIENQIEIPKNISFIETAGKYSVVIADGSIYFWDGRDEAAQTTSGFSGIKDISLSADGNIICVFADRAQIFKLN